MGKLATAALIGAALSCAFAAPANAKGKIIGVSWSNFQEERWKTDEAAMKSAIAAAGDKYISADAQSSAQKQLTDIESLIAQHANALIVLAAGRLRDRARGAEGGRRRHCGDRL